MSSFSLRWRRAVAAVATAVVVGLVVAASAQAHAFLIRSDPEAGARLAVPPGRLTLYLSERFVAGSERIRINRANGDAVELVRPETQRTTVVQPLPAKLRGIFIVHWRVLSDDGHTSLGEFAFAVGSAAALPQLEATPTQTSASQVVASWLFFVGLALAFGGLVSERFIWARGDLTPRRTPPVLAGLVVASLGALAELITIAGGRAGGGFGAGLAPSALRLALGSRPGTLTLVVLVALAVAAVAATSPRTRPLALPALLIAIVATSLRGHSGTSGDTWAVVADVVHLTGVALWVGALVHLVLVAAGRRGGETVDVVAGVRRYAGLALVATLVVIVSGVATALAEFRGVGELTSTSYGRTLIVKACLVGLALALALGARLRVLSGNPSVRLPLLRLLTRAETAALAAVLIAVALLVNIAPPRSTATAAAAASPVLGPPPLRGPAVRLAALAGQLVVGLAATGRELQFTIVPPTQAAGRATLTAAAQPPAGKSVDLYPRPCGDGCFVIRYRLRRGATTISADVGAPGWSGGKARFAVPWPPKRPADALLRRVTETMTALPRVVLTEAVTSGYRSGGRPTTYRLTGKSFVATELFRSGAVDVRNLGRQRGLTELAFALPGSTIWYRIWVDDHERIRREIIVSTGHLIHRSFRYGATANREPVRPLRRATRHGRP